MAISVKGGANRPQEQKPTTQKSNPVAEAYARLEKKKSKKAKKGGAADDVGEVLDETVRDEGDLQAELEVAKKMADEVTEEMPEGTGMEQAEAIAEKLKQKIESTRGQRGHLARKIQKKFEEL